MHLTFPRARLEWCTCKDGIWLQALLDRNHTWEFRWNDEEADIREMKQIGPFRSPDEMRDALGLPRIAQFRTPEGRTFTAELPRAHTTGKQMSREQALEELAAVQQLAASPMEDMELVRKEAKEAVERMAARASYNVKSDLEQVATVVETAVEELLADPPKVETATEVAEPPKAAARKVSVKRPGGRK